MNKENLQQVWSKLEPSEEGVFQYKLISEHSVPILCLGFKGIKKALILEVPANADISRYKDNERENISFINLKTAKCLCIVLEDSYFEDLFDDLVLSIFTHTVDISSIETYLSSFHRTFMKWSSLFAGKHNEGLTPYQLQGLIGELLYLEHQIDGTTDINEELNSWRGPYDEGHDFIKESLDIEVKTITQTSNNVKISSEFQLESAPGKSLVLAVIRLMPNTENGISLSVIIDRLKDQIILKDGDLSIFVKALLQKGIDSYTAQNYKNQRFIPQNLEKYTCDSERFPKIIRSNSHDAINSIKYSINLTLLTDFKLSQIDF
tara:strand:- start:2148 stop:3107 length:960 start_codon:yes stop_codon:yes gene_type:complete